MKALNYEFNSYKSINAQSFKKGRAAFLIGGERFVTANGKHNTIFLAEEPKVLNEYTVDSFLVDEDETYFHILQELGVNYEADESFEFKLKPVQVDVLYSDNVSDFEPLDAVVLQLNGARHEGYSGYLKYYGNICIRDYIFEKSSFVQLPYE